MPRSLELFHDTCEEWDEETVTTEDLIAIAFLTIPNDALLMDVVDHIHAIDQGM